MRAAVGAAVGAAAGSPRHHCLQPDTDDFRDKYFQENYLIIIIGGMGRGRGISCENPTTATEEAVVTAAAPGYLLNFETAT